MKKIFYLLTLNLVVYINIFGQDTLPNNSSWSFTAGTKFIYPTINQYSAKSQYVNPSYGYDYFIEPKWSFNQWFMINYEHFFFVTKKYSFSVISGLGYTQNKYKCIATGWYISDFPPYGDSGTFNLSVINNYAEIDIGLSSKIRINNKLFWNNSLNVSSNILLGHFNQLIKDEEINDNTKNLFYICFNTGLMFNLKKYFYITPTINYSLFQLLKKNNEHYNFFIIGLKVTYFKTKKQ